MRTDWNPIDVISILFYHWWVVQEQEPWITPNFFVGDNNFSSRVTRSPRIPEQEDDAVGAAVEGVRRLLAGHVARYV